MTINRDRREYFRTYQKIRYHKLKQQRLKMTQTEQRQALAEHSYARTKKCGISYNLRVKDIIIPSHCPVLNTPLKAITGFQKGLPDENKASLDRINNKHGYSKANIEVMSWRANKLKSDATLEELVALGKWAEAKLSQLSPRPSTGLSPLSD